MIFYDVTIQLTLYHWTRDLNPVEVSHLDLLPDCQYEVTSKSTEVVTLSVITDSVKEAEAKALEYYRPKAYEKSRHSERFDLTVASILVSSNQPSWIETDTYTFNSMRLEAERWTEARSPQCL